MLCSADLAWLIITPHHCSSIPCMPTHFFVPLFTPLFSYFALPRHSTRSLTNCPSINVNLGPKTIFTFPSLNQIDKCPYFVPTSQFSCAPSFINHQNVSLPPSHHLCPSHPFIHSCIGRNVQFRHSSLSSPLLMLTFPFWPAAAYFFLLAISGSSATMTSGRC